MGSITDIITALEPYAEQISVQAILGYLDTAVPFFSLPVISQIVSFLVTQFIDLIVTKLGIVTLNLTTIIETGMQNQAFVAAATANLQAQTNGNQDDKNQAKQNLLNAARNFIKFSSP